MLGEDREELPPASGPGAVEGVVPYSSSLVYPLFALTVGVAGLLSRRSV